MRHERGFVLVNALILVLVIASAASVLLTRSEGARMRAATAQQAAGLEAQLDAAEMLALRLTGPAVAEGGLVHKGQEWAAEQHVYQIEGGRVRAVIDDMQGRMNINWLAGGEDAFADQAFRQLFAELDLPISLLDAIRDFLRPGGPRALPAYLRRAEPLQPRGGPVQVLDELRVVTGMGPAEFDLLERHVTALPPDEGVNLNTATPPVLRAVLHPFPSEVRAEFTRPGRDGPIEHLRELRDLTIAILETEDISDLPFDRLTVSSRFFRADLFAELDGRIAARRVILRRARIEDTGLRVAYRWALRD